MLSVSPQTIISDAADAYVSRWRQLDFMCYGCVLLIMSIGLIMVASSSMDFAHAQYHDAWFFIKKQIIFLGLGCTLGLVILAIPIKIWNRFSGLLLIAGLFLLAAVLIPGVGKVVNGSRRWLSLGLFSVQASELAKFCFVIYFASFLSRKNEELKTQWSGFIKITFIMLAIICLLLMEPDFGTSVIISMVAGIVMFVAGVPIIRFALLALSGIAGLVAIAVFSPYRWERLVAFMDPWSRQFDSGYQLVQSLIAFGRGEWFGVGLGNSLQKLFFLPEAHTDFIFAIYTEEFGYIGALGLIALFSFLLSRLLMLFNKACIKQQFFSAYLILGVAVMIAAQAFINMGVASGLLPTKGLTLPFISYGGSSMLVTCCLIALVMRINLELADDKP